MGRVTPGEIVAFIERTLSPARTQKNYILDAGNYKNSVSALLRLADELPSELRPTDGPEYSRFILNVETLRSTLKTEAWVSSGDMQAPSWGRALGNAVHDLYECLILLPNQQIPAATAGLLFIEDQQLRENIRADIAAAEQAFSGEGWKAATVLAGAVAEALLRWAIMEKKTDTERESAREAKIPKANRNPDWWGLHEYTVVSRHLELIKDDAAKQAALAKNFRNLIHPGRAARLNQVCNKGTAHAALAAVEFILEDFEKTLAS
jgi:hypothetical protein